MSKTTKPDAKLLRLEVKFNAASDRWNEATARTAELEEEELRIRSRRAKAEKKEEKRAEAFVRARDRIMNTRARSLEGLAVKMRARERDYTDAKDLEIEILKSLVDDIKVMTDKALHGKPAV
ncbi:hypothetical protein [Mesorhizobium sp. M0522]|uniref:hypothetical protein n=1 Tax=Mesorhizobium sp. M0522 TaxID=2956958 RepID=UPI00333633BC